jgi:hypothetical protein
MIVASINSFGPNRRPKPRRKAGTPLPEPEPPFFVETLLFDWGPFEDGPPEEGPFGDEASVFAIAEEGVRLLCGFERAIVQHEHDRVTRKTLPICVSDAS